MSTSVVEKTSISLAEIAGRVSASRRVLPAFAATGLVLALLAWVALPRTYVSEATLLPSTGDETAGLTGGLLSLAGTLGISVPGTAVPESHLYPAILKSERVLEDALTTALDPADPQGGTIVDRIGGRDPSERRMEEAIETVRGRILRVGLDEETGIVRVTVRMRDPKVANRTAEVLLQKLEGYLSNERNARSRRNLEFVASRRAEAQADLGRAEDALKEFRDANRKIMNSPDLLLEEGRLLREIRVQEEVFLELTRQHEIAKIEAEKATPILEILDPPTLHHAPESPRLPILLGVGLLLGIVVGSLYATVRDAAPWGGTPPLSMLRALKGQRA
ncbi:MAG: hypothetical protein ACT4PE_00065 [Candidatus Eiseniibacteriota bacterium]